MHFRFSHRYGGSWHATRCAVAIVLCASVWDSCDLGRGGYCLWKAIAAIIVPGVVVVILYVWLNPSSEKAPDFALSMSPFIFHNSPNGMWFGTSSETTRTISPVGLLVGIRILNTQNVPAFVERYSFYAWENGQWNLLNRIDTRFGGLFLVMNGDFAHASPQHSGQFIDREIGKKQIGPREARHG
jgi:hypothetical protein